MNSNNIHQKCIRYAHTYALVTITINTVSLNTIHDKNQIQPNQIVRLLDGIFS